MGKTKEMAMDILLELMTDIEWMEAVAEEKDRLERQYGYGIYSKIKFGEFLNKNK